MCVNRKLWEVFSEWILCDVTQNTGFPPPPPPSYCYFVGVFPPTFSRREKEGEIDSKACKMAGMLRSEISITVEEVDTNSSNSNSFETTAGDSSRPLAATTTPSRRVKTATGTAFTWPTSAASPPGLTVTPATTNNSSSDYSNDSNNNDDNNDSNDDDGDKGDDDNSDGDGGDDGGGGPNTRPSSRQLYHYFHRRRSDDGTAVAGGCLACSRRRASDGDSRLRLLGRRSGELYCSQCGQPLLTSGGYWEHIYMYIYFRVFFS